LAKRLELEGWDYPKHLAGRIFSVVVHGDAEGAAQVRGALSDWLLSMGLQSAGATAEIDRYIGYWKPYATSHEELDADTAIQDEVRRAACTLAEATQAARTGKLLAVTPNSPPPRQK
jgi:multimeric flavodoxin WrbA